jgi:hypothetical protein
LKAARHLGDGFEAKRLERSDREIMMDERAAQRQDSQSSWLNLTALQRGGQQPGAIRILDIALNYCVRCCCGMQYTTKTAF